MATSPTVEQAEQHVNTLPVAESASPRGVSWKFTIDGNLVMIAGLLALAITAFSSLNSRVDRLDTKIDGVASELRSEMKQLGAEMKRYAERTDDKIDRLTDKVNELIINQSRGK